MTPRSMATPTRPETQNAAGIANAIRQPDHVRHQLLNQIGGVGAEHDQLAVSHVDHAHDAERDRQADRRQYQHGACAEPEEQGLYVTEKLDAFFDIREGGAGQIAHRRLGVLFGETQQVVTHGRGQAFRHGSDGLLANGWVGIAEPCQGQGLQHDAADIRVRFGLEQTGEQFGVFRLRIGQQIFDCHETHCRVVTRQFQFRQLAADLSTHSVIDRELTELALAKSAEFFSGQRIDRNVFVVSLLHPDQALFRLDVTQLAFEQAPQQCRRLRMARLGQGVHTLLFDVECTVPQQLERRIECRVAGLDIGRHCRERDAQQQQAEKKFRHRNSNIGCENDSTGHPAGAVA
jgi:hypothetical protein